MIDLPDFMQRASLATVLGLLIRFEREARSKPLGFYAYLGPVAEKGGLLR